MSAVEQPSSPIEHGSRDPRKIAHSVVRTLVKVYYRAEALDADHVPVSGGALLVSNHSGGLLSMDVPVIATAIWDALGTDRDFRVLAHDMLMTSVLGQALAPLGFLAASPENAHAALCEGAATVVFPGGDWDAFRPSSKANVVDFGGRTGYVRAALAADVPIVPVVSIGGHETQFVLSRGEAIAKALPWMAKFRTAILPVVVGVPFGITIGIPQFPLPSKIVTRFLAPLNLREEFGPDPDPAEIDEVVRSRMQSALDELAAARRFPVLG